MNTYIVVAIVAVGVVALVAAIAWGLLGPRRASDEAGPHVELAEQTRQRERARQAGLEPDGSGGTGQRSE